MNTLFITFDFHEQNKPVKSVAVATLEGYLLKNIDNIYVDSFSFNMNDEYTIIFEQMVALREILSKKHEFIQISFYAWNMKFIGNLLQVLRSDCPGAQLVAGGYEVNKHSVDNLKSEFKEIDHFIIGYAEESLLLLLKGGDNSVVLNHYVDNNLITDIYNNGIIEVNKRSIVRLESKRGCPSKCSFCAYKNNDHKKITTHDIIKVKRELSFLNDAEVEKVNVLDPIFTLKNNIQLLEFLVEINFKPIISLQMKFEILHNEMKKNPLILSLLKKLNIELEFGLQSISNNVLENIERVNDLKKIREVIIELNKNNIKYELSIIRGLPGETRTSFNNLISFLNENDCKNYIIYPLTLLSNTKLHQERDKLGIRTYIQNGLEYVIGTYSYNYSDYLNMN